MSGTCNCVVVYDIITERHVWLTAPGAICPHIHGKPYKPKGVGGERPVE